MDSTSRPSYRDLTPDQRKQLCNGVGSDWMPRWLRKLLTLLSGWFFDEASWCHHDFGYTIGYTEVHRLEYDRKFLAAMLRDADRLSGLKRMTAQLLARVFYRSVRAFGGKSFYYADRYRTMDELFL